MACDSPSWKSLILLCFSIERYARLTNETRFFAHKRLFLNNLAIDMRVYLKINNYYFLQLSLNPNVENVLDNSLRLAGIEA